MSLVIGGRGPSCGRSLCGVPVEIGNAECLLYPGNSLESIIETVFPELLMLDILKLFPKALVASLPVVAFAMLERRPYPPR
jgi:hypothetical protein